MSRKKTEINPIRGERVKVLIEREGISQIDFANRIFQTQQNVSRIINLKTALTEGTAQDIVSAFPDYRVGWLLGYDDIMLKSDFEREYIRKKDIENSAIIQLLENALYEICQREEIAVPTLDNIPELILLEAQLRDFADSLVWNYLHRQDSHVWNYLDQI